ncbi:MAG: hypothetical protein ACRDZM_12245 [Acidimicrobiia bacterium]
MTEHTPDFDQNRPIEDWTDEDLLAEFRFIKAELAADDPKYQEGGGAPADVVEQEIKRRGLKPDREDVIPDASNPGREGGEAVPHIRG